MRKKGDIKYSFNLLKQIYGEADTSTLLIDLLEYGIEVIKSEHEIKTFERVVFEKKRLESIWRYNDAEVDFINLVAKVNGNVTKLGPVPIRILKVLLENEGQALSREQILESVWGSKMVLGDRTIDVHISMLKKTLNLGGYINSVRNVGYKIN